MMTIRRSRRATASRFGRYALAAASASGAAATTARADFSGPYTLNPPANGSYNAPATLGTWSGVYSAGSNNPVVDTTSAPAFLTLSEGAQFNASQALVTLSTSIVGSGTLSFSYSLGINGGGFAAYVVNNAVTSFATLSNTGNVGGTQSFSVNAGDTFGFRLGVNYGSSGSLQISNFAAPVPEPTVNALIAAGAVGLLGLRETRRRRRAKLAAV